ncbi:hypothetical protein KKG45_00500 [bacterium]|nr:hypothetical protein [bacterium]MBU1071704.1 hypothetical protein [bacterium]MBU1676482.1 hypothetical protein [bacterium]
MRTVVALIIISFIAGSAVAQQPGSREELYCQPVADYTKASGPTGDTYSEKADDIPDALAGQVISTVTFYVNVYDGDCVWEAPDGFAVNFYFSQCPPGQTADLTYAYDWSELSPELVAEVFPCYLVYHVRAVLPETVVITTEMSLGFSPITSWGPGEWPSAGVRATERGEFYGCGSQWYDDALHTRWEQGSEPYYYTDIAYCLEGYTVPNETLDWGEVRALYR